MAHVVLLGDSIFDNARYVPGRPDVPEQLRRALPRDCRVTMLARRKPTALCTIYDAVPGLEREELTALSVWNDVILREAFRAGVPVLDLRLICSDPADYSSLSPIEPSERGGAKIVAAIVRLLAGHDFSRRVAAVYGTAHAE